MAFAAVKFETRVLLTDGSQWGYNRIITSDDVDVAGLDALRDEFGRLLSSQYKIENGDIDGHKIMSSTGRMALLLDENLHAVGLFKHDGAWVDETFAPKDEQGAPDDDGSTEHVRTGSGASCS